METKQVSNDFCSCGRALLGKPHCPACGSGMVYARAINDSWIIVPSGERSEQSQNEQSSSRMLLRGFRCRRCYTDFNEGTKCEAPPNRTRQGIQTQVEQKLKEATELLKQSGGRQEKINKLFKPQ